MSILKKIASFIWDIPIERSSSPQNAYLEVVWSYGKKMLNTKNANYSFGNGYKVFEYAFKQIEDQLSKASNVLVLGFGCGSVEQLLLKRQLNVDLIGVEYDQEIIRLYQTHFQPETHNSTIHALDAKAFLEDTKEQFDIIIIDLFDDLNTVPMVYNSDFTQLLLKRCKPNSTLIYNTVKNPKQLAARTDLSLELSRSFKEVRVHPFQDINEIIIAK